jgi:protein O-mannosyl-transferase
VSLASLVRGFLRLVPEKLPFFALCGVLVLITLDAQRGAMSPLDKYTVWDRLANVAVSYVGYLGTFAWPDRLAVFYPLYPERQTAAGVAACAALLVALTAAAVGFGLRRRHLLFGWLWYVGTLVPVIGLVQVGMQSMADRYVYIPFWGLACAVAWTLQEALRARPLARPARAAAAALAVTALAVLGTLTFRQSACWKDGLTLFSSALANTEDNYLAHSVLAERFFADEEFERSIEHSIEAAKSRRNMGAVRSTYGLALYNLGRRAEALEQFKLAAEQEPDNPLGFMNLGWFEAERGRYDQALADLETAAGRISEETLPYTKRTTYANWANALAKTGQLEKAREKYELALEVDDADVAVLRDAARIDLQLRDAERATARLRRVLELAPDDADAPWLLACAAQLAGGDAAPLYASARERAPRQALVAIELARTLARQARFDEAAGLVRTVLALPPPADPAEARLVASAAHANLAEIRLAQGDLREAMADLERALAVDPTCYDANNRLAFLLATNADSALRDPARAVALAERAVATRREAASLATLATAQAAAGSVPAALGTAREALALAKEASDPNAIAAVEHQLAVFAGMQATADGTARP